MGELVDQMLRNVEVGNFGNPVMEEKISRFDIPMKNIIFVQFLEPLQHVIGHFPDLYLRDAGLGGEGLLNSTLQIASIGKFHHDA